MSGLPEEQVSLESLLRTCEGRCGKLADLAKQTAVDEHGTTGLDVGARETVMDAIKTIDRATVLIRDALRAEAYMQLRAKEAGK